MLVFNPPLKSESSSNLSKIKQTDMLIDAKNNPSKHPGIVARVAGYCAYFDDLPNTVKQEIIKRARLTTN